MVDLGPVRLAPVAQALDGPGQRACAVRGAQIWMQSRILAACSMSPASAVIGAGAVARDRVGFREGIELDHRVAPFLANEEAVRPVHALRQEVPIGLVDHEIDAAPAAELGEALDHVRRIDRAGRVVGRDEDDRPHAPVDQRLRILDARHEAGIRPAGQRARLDAEHVERHLVIEVPGRRQEHGIAAMGASSIIATKKAMLQPGRDRHVRRLRSGPRRAGRARPHRPAGESASPPIGPYWREPAAEPAASASAASSSGWGALPGTAWDRLISGPQAPS